MTYKWFGVSFRHLDLPVHRGDQGPKAKARHLPDTGQESGGRGFCDKEEDVEITQEVIQDIAAEIILGEDKVKPLDTNIEVIKIYVSEITQNDGMEITGNRHIEITEEEEHYTGDERITDINIYDANSPQSHNFLVFNEINIYKTKIGKEDDIPEISSKSTKPNILVKTPTKN